MIFFNIQYIKMKLFLILTFQFKGILIMKLKSPVSGIKSLLICSNGWFMRERIKGHCIID